MLWSEVCDHFQATLQCTYLNKKRFGSTEVLVLLLLVPVLSLQPCCQRAETREMWANPIGDSECKPPNELQGNPVGWGGKPEQESWLALTCIIIYRRPDKVISCSQNEQMMCLAHVKQCGWIKSRSFVTSVYLLKVAPKVSHSTLIHTVVLRVLPSGYKDN